MAVTSWLIDKSAYARLYSGKVAARELWDSRIVRGLVHLSTMTRLELGFSVRSGQEGRQGFQTPPVRLMPIQYLTPRMEDRAFEVQMLLADRGQHRIPSSADLLIAATAELAGLTLLAVDKDFELIAAVTGQPVENLEER